MRLVKIIKIILIILVVCWLGVFGWFVFPQLSCSSESASNQVPEDQLVTVQRGDLRIDITAVGNLVLSRKEDLKIDLFYKEGTVEEVLVEEGETVEEGQVVARVSTSEWEKELATLEHNVTKTKVSYTTAKVALDQAESQTSVADLEMEIKQEQVKRARQQYWEASIRYDYGKISEADLLQAAAALRSTEAALATAITDPAGIEAKRLQVELTEAQFRDAERELAEAHELSPEVRAPFAGFITKVNVEGGDEIKDGTVAVSIADPNKFEAEIMVSEMDILQVKLAGEASVQVDAMPTINLPAKVTHISPTATIQSGVVNYKVKVEIQSLEAVQQEWEEARQKAMQEISPEVLPERIRQAIEEGLITQEQAEEMMKQGQQGQGRQEGLIPMMIPEDFQLREGLTVTVSILVEERNDVLLVPNAAIVSRGRETYVPVLKDGVIEQRAIKTGISNWQYTEVTDGLSEGEKVIIPETTTTPTTESGGPPGGIRIPGMRRM